MLDSEWKWDQFSTYWGWSWEWWDWDKGRCEGWLDGDWWLVDKVGVWGEGCESEGLRGCCDVRVVEESESEEMGGCGVWRSDCYRICWCVRCTALSHSVNFTF